MNLSKHDGRVFAFVANEDVKRHMASNVARKGPIP